MFMCSQHIQPYAIWLHVYFCNLDTAICSQSLAKVDKKKEYIQNVCLKHNTKLVKLMKKYAV